MISSSGQWSRHVLSPDAGSTKTNWPMIFQAAGSDDDASAQALEQLARRYWPAVFAYVRSSGHDIHEASDLTQGFVCDVMIGRKLFNEADPNRGRFRTLLLCSLKNYLRERHRHATRKKRSHNGRKPLSLDQSDTDMVIVARGQTPEEAFNSQWSATLIREVLDSVRRTCIVDGMEAHWVVFESRVVRPMLMGEKPMSYRKLVERLELADRSQAANMMITIKRRFARALLAETGRTMSDPDRARVEIMDMLNLMEKPS